MSKFFKLSESRGKEAAGLTIRSKGQLFTHKQDLPAGEMLRSQVYKSFLAEALEGWDPSSGLIAIGHSRLVTNGTQLNAFNNQPIVSNGLALIHNGIIVNDADLWKNHPNLVRLGQVDSEVLLRLIEKLMEGLPAPIAISKAFSLLQGSASIALAIKMEDAVVLATNTGSLYFGEDTGYKAFASERYILSSALGTTALKGKIKQTSIRQVKPGTGIILELTKSAAQTIELGNYPKPSSKVDSISKPTTVNPERNGSRLRRCTKCILPETMPFVDFDADGVCFYCRSHRPIEYRGRESLEKVLEKYRSVKGEPDCIVALSGGRDSSFGLHLLKQELGMHPIAFTYDWGMVTDLGRRNQARMCGQLGVEQILVSADIKKKRDNVRRNIEAWLRKPNLGMIPLFMAGDKQFFQHANQLSRITGIKLVVFCENPLEKTNFKTGFLGIREGGQRLYNMAPLQKLKLNLAYMQEFLRNPAYLNRSLLDTAQAFKSAYMINHDYLFPFQYFPWEEKVVDQTLLGTYGWETSPDSSSTWRIGDGTASFYNFIYYTVAGFTEFDTFRSNQIREKILNRDEALRLVEIENKLRLPSMREYAELIGFDLDYAMRVIQAIPKLYTASDSNF